jgi:hypothetical protein
MKCLRSFNFFRSHGAAHAALGGLVAQLLVVPAIGGRSTHAGSIFEVSSPTAPSAQQANLSAEQVQALLRQLDAAVNEAVLENPEVAEAIENAIAEQWPEVEAALPEQPEAAPSPAPSAEPEAAPSPAPSLEAGAPTPVFSAGPSNGPAPSPSATPSAPRARESWDRVFGWDFILGVPSGVGFAINVTPIRPITVSVGVSTPLGVTVTAQAEVTLNILPIFMNSRWTPTVTVGYRYVHFTGLTDRAIDLASGGALAQSDIAFEVKGTGLHMVNAMVGLEYVGKKGFHFGLRAGRLMQVGSSVGQTDESGLVLSNLQSWSVLLMFGRRY